MRLVFSPVLANSAKDRRLIDLARNGAAGYLGYTGARSFDKWRGVPR